MTELGRFIKNLRTDKGEITQEKLASDFGYSSSKLSNIMNGTTAPDIAFIAKCQHYFKLDKTQTGELVLKALAAHKTITLDTSYFVKDRKELLIWVITVLLLMPESNVDNGNQINIESMIKNIIQNFEYIEKVRDISVS
jgi:transcriptional regulator with XRE-family HTH domain